MAVGRPHLQALSAKTWAAPWERDRLCRGDGRKQRRIVNLCLPAVICSSLPRRVNILLYLSLCCGLPRLCRALPHSPCGCSTWPSGTALAVLQLAAPPTGSPWALLGRQPPLASLQSLGCH